MPARKKFTNLHHPKLRYLKDKIKTGSFDNLFKVRLLGEVGVGLSSLILRYSDNVFLSHVDTLGVEYKEKTVRIKNRVIKNRIWDTYKRTKNPSLDNFQAIMLAFDLTNLQSFKNLLDYLKTIKAHAEENVTIILVGTKCDDQLNRKVPREAIDQFMRLHALELSGYMETSAKTGENVNAAFELVTKQLLKRLKQRQRQEVFGNLAKTALIEDLEQYVHSIEQHRTTTSDNPDFSHGFWFFVDSRAYHREANYLLAKSLLKALMDPTHTIREVFNNIEARRENMIDIDRIWKRKDYTDRGIKSSELKSIIHKARALDLML